MIEGATRGYTRVLEINPRVALIITLLKMQIKQNNSTVYLYIFKKARTRGEKIYSNSYRKRLFTNEMKWNEMEFVKSK